MGKELVVLTVKNTNQLI